MVPSSDWSHLCGPLESNKTLPALAGWGWSIESTYYPGSHGNLAGTCLPGRLLKIVQTSKAVSSRSLPITTQKAKDTLMWAWDCVSFPALTEMASHSNLLQSHLLPATPNMRFLSWQLEIWMKPQLWLFCLKKEKQNRILQLWRQKKWRRLELSFQQKSCKTTFRRIILRVWMSLLDPWFH